MYKLKQFLEENQDFKNYNKSNPRRKQRGILEEC